MGGPATMRATLQYTSCHVVRCRFAFAPSRFTWAFELVLAAQASREVGLHGVKRIYIDLLLLMDDAVRTQRPPLVRCEVGRDFRLRTAASEPLDQVQIIRLR